MIRLFQIYIVLIINLQMPLSFIQKNQCLQPFQLSYYLSIIIMRSCTEMIFLAILLSAFTLCTHGQLECANYYDQNNLPSQCQQETQICSFQSIDNSSLIQNSTIVNQTYIVCINLPLFTINIGPEPDILQLSLFLYGANINLISNYSLISSGKVVLNSTNTITISNCTLTAQMMWIQGAEVVISNYSTIKNEQLIETTCSCTSKNSNCSINPYYFPFLFSNIVFPSNFSMQFMNYTFNEWNFLGKNVKSVVITANTSITIQTSNIKISVIAIYTTSLTLSNSTLNTSGLGFPSGTGYGCGYFGEVLNQLLGCTGTGASHGGYGGNSYPDNCNLLMSNPPYGRQTIPRYPGSGGGFFLKQVTEVSSGGGVINMQVLEIYIAQSQILSDGIGGIQGGGGGSGGAISIDYYQMTSSVNSTISASGGSGKSSGGGGRIRVWNHNWINPSTSQQSATNFNHFRIYCIGGSGCQSQLTCGEDGSITTSPCPPGFSLNKKTYMCDFCKQGSYQLSYGYGYCSTCINRPKNSDYINSSQLQLSQLVNYSKVCNFTCNKDFKQYKNKQCLSSFQYLLVDVGGINLLICIGIITASIIIFLIITMIRKLSYSDNNLIEQNQNIDFYKKRSYFKIEDIPFHQFRIYLEGDNTPKRPWRITENITANIKDLYQDDLKTTVFFKLFRQLNQICNYSTHLSWFLYLLKFVYYPLSLFLAQFFREKKAKAIRQAILNKYKDLQSNIGIKFHVNNQYTVGCLQFFNYHKETLDYYIKNYFPMYFKVQKLIVGGYAIDFSDPLLKAFYSQFEYNNQKKLENYLMQLNQLLRTLDPTIFKHLWRISQYSPLLQCYLWQPPKLLAPRTQENQQIIQATQAQTCGMLGIDNKLSINKQQDLFLVFSIQGKDSLCSNNQMSSLQIRNGQSKAQSKFSKHFYYGSNFPNIYFDQISCIRHKYNLRQSMVEIDDKKTVFWQIDSNIDQKYLSWTLGIISIITLLIQLLAFFLIIFIMVEYKDQSFVFGFIIYFVLFPVCEYFMVFIQFSLVISKGYQVFSYAIYFTVFCIAKNLICTIFLLLLMIQDDFNSSVLLILFYIWLALLILEIVSLIMLCMLNIHLSKAK